MRITKLCFISISELPQIDSLILAVPLSNLPFISIGMVKPDANEEDDKIEQILEDIVPEKEASISGMANLWNSLTKEFVQVAPVPLFLRQIK